MSDPTNGALPWFAGVWQRDGISVPGAPYVEPCDAWWVQSDRWFVDIRLSRPGHEDNTLPYSQTRLMAGWFRQADGWSEWNVLIDSARETPATDRAAADGLTRSEHEPDLMVEDAPGRFTERWLDRCHGELSPALTIAEPDHVEVQLGDWTAYARRKPSGRVMAALSRRGETVIELSL